MLKLYGIAEFTGQMDVFFCLMYLEVGPHCIAELMPRKPFRYQKPQSGML